jgi:hypothetical protein
LEVFVAANAAAGQIISASGSVDSEEMLSAAAAAVGPIGAGYLAAYGPAQANNLASTLLVADAHTGIGAVTDASRMSFIAADSV